MIDIEQSLDDALTRYLGSACPKNLIHAIRYSLLAPGKRIRPRLLLGCAQMIGLSPEAALPSALALEMIHCFTLIHDDLPCMDNDDIRRGQPTNHKKFGEALALLAGDALIPMAWEIFSESAAYVPYPSFVQAMRRMSVCVGAKGVIGGQAQEMLLTEGGTLDDLRQMHEKKTGALFSASVLIPKDLAGITDDSSEGLAIEIFGKELGLAFQALDDLEDATPENALNNILFYLSKKDVVSMTLQRLSSASLTLTSAWGTEAQPLITIAEEVYKKIEGMSDE